MSLQSDGMKEIQMLSRNGWIKTNRRQMANVDLWKQIHYWVSRHNHVVVQHVPVSKHIEGNSLTDRGTLRNLLVRYR